MKGYVENVGKAPIYVLKGTVGIGERINFDVLERRFGSEAGTKDSNVFAAWLSKNKFVDGSIWKVVVEDKPAKSKQKEPKVEPKEEKKEDKPVSKVTATNREIITKAVGGVFKEMTIDDIINMKVSELRQLERIKDEKLLRAALKKAERMDKKTMLCNKIRDKLLEFDMR
jgi:hypothetical protein